MNRFICIHAHFYQPPRENPWLEDVELQDSAYPFHDWNERITAECYGPNTASRLLDSSGKIVGIVNNFARISYNIGPTLFSWMEVHAPAVYEAILEADPISMDIFSGHGSALAQVYNHMIMPLANSRDKRTQVLWGIRDFERRFARRPEGIWLAETAVDLETLELLVDEGIRFTLLAPRQAAAVRPIGTEKWHDVGDSRIDPRRPYLCTLPSGRAIDLFFYDGGLAQDIAFGGLLSDGEAFANRLLAIFSNKPDNEPQLAHIATDGETYGHHHKHGEMALTYCLHAIEAREKARITVYGEYLDMFPPTWEVQIFENSSWSCIHGVERWRGDCGCNSGMNGHWNQTWRKPLRGAIDWLRDKLTQIFEDQASTTIRDGWKARDEYLRVIQDRSPENIGAFFSEFALGQPTAENLTTMLRLLEMQRNAMLMYTSCGWFFDEISGLESTQVLQYASRAIQLAAELGVADLEDEFTVHLADVPTNIPALKDGREIYARFVKPARIDLPRVAAHFAMIALFDESLAGLERIYCYRVKTIEYNRTQAGRTRLATGRVIIQSMLTLESRSFSFVVLHLGNQNLHGGVRDFMGEAAYAQMKKEVAAAFERSDTPEIIRVIDHNYKDMTLSLWHLFRDDQRKILSMIFAEAERSIETFYRNVYQDYYQLISVMQTLATPLPRILQLTAEFVLNRDLRRALEQSPVDEERFRSIVADVHKWSVELDKSLLGFIGTKQMNRLADELAVQPLDLELIGQMTATLDKYHQIQLSLDLWYSQNVILKISMQQYFIRSSLAPIGDPLARRWVELFGQLADKMGVKVQ